MRDRDRLGNRIGPQAHDADAGGPKLARENPGERLDGRFVQRVHLGGLGNAAGGRDLLGHLLELGEGTTGQHDPRSLAREGAGHRAADGAASSVDHGVLVAKQHVNLLCV